MSKVLIDRALLERVQERLDPHRDAVLWGAVCDTFHTAPSGTPAMPVKAYYHEAPNEYGGFNRSVGLEVRKAFIDAPLVLESDAMECIACLEGDLAKRDARIMGLESQYQRDVYGLNNEGDPIGGDPAGGYANDNARLRTELAALKAQEPVAEVKHGPLDSSGWPEFVRVKTIGDLDLENLPNGMKFYAAPVSEAKAQGVVMPERESFMAGVKAASDKVKAIVEDYDQRHGSTDPDTGTREYPGNGEEWVCCMLELIEDFTGIVAPSSLNAAPVSSGDPEKCSYQDDPRSPAELSLAGCNCVRFGECNPHWPCKLHTPAADAGIVDMYRHLQKVTPYRFKKIQDASITDGGDVMYFHKDRFDAALLADMAVHCAKGVV